MNQNIPSPREDFLDSSGKISRPWYTFLLGLFDSIGVSSIEDLEVSQHATLSGLTPNPFIDVDPRVVSQNFNTLESGLAQLRQELVDFRSLVETAPISRDSGSSGDEITCAAIEAVGYWTPVTDGASNIIFNGDGEVVNTFVCTE